MTNYRNDNEVDVVVTTTSSENSEVKVTASTTAAEDNEVNVSVAATTTQEESRRTRDGRKREFQQCVDHIKNGVTKLEIMAMLNLTDRQYETYWSKAIKEELITHQEPAIPTVLAKYLHSVIRKKLGVNPNAIIKVDGDATGVFLTPTGIEYNPNLKGKSDGK